MARDRGLPVTDVQWILATPIIHTNSDLNPLTPRKSIADVLAFNGRRGLGGMARPGRWTATGADSFENMFGEDALLDRHGVLAELGTGGRRGHRNGGPARKNWRHGFPARAPQSSWQWP